MFYLFGGVSAKNTEEVGGNLPEDLHWNVLPAKQPGPASESIVCATPGCSVHPGGGICQSTAILRKRMAVCPLANDSRHLRR